MKSIKNIFSWLDQNIEKIIIIISYSVMAGIIFVEVIRRFVFSVQAPWSTTIPILLFLWLTWFGASYNLKTRTHLALTEVRKALSYRGQFYCFVLDAVAWIVFAIIVIWFTVQQVYLSYDNFAIVGGTDDVMEWWFYLATPLAWSLIIVRALQNLVQDIQRYRRGEEFTMQFALKG
jgi:TRAP-type C4-dicarboxylate transport system permease small subunit